MRTPASCKDVSKEWLQHILRGHHAAVHPQGSLEVLTFTRNPDAADGLNSEAAFFGVATTQREDADSPVTHKTYQLMTKMLSPDPFSSSFNRKFKAHIKEYLIYTEVIKALNESLMAKAPHEPKICIPDLIHGKCTNKEYVLVMENITYDGYEVNDKYKGLDFQQLKLAVDQLVRLHALSYVYSQSTDICKKYPCFKQGVEAMAWMEPVMVAVIECISLFLKESSETAELGNRMDQSKLILKDKLLSVIKEEHVVMCLLHGDYWNSNLMYTYKEPGEDGGERVAEGMKMIDWGTSRWGFPLFDLHYLLHTSTTRAVREAHQEELLHHYHSTFMKLVTDMGSSPPSWTFDQFKMDWERTYVFGFLLGCALTVSTLSFVNSERKKPEPSVLDNPFLSPLKTVVRGLQAGVAKAMMSFMATAAGKKLMQAMTRKMLQAFQEELRSGKNEVMNVRLLGLVHEADDKGLFTPS